MHVGYMYCVFVLCMVSVYNHIYNHLPLAKHIACTSLYIHHVHGIFVVYARVCLGNAHTHTCACMHNLYIHAHTPHTHHVCAWCTRVYV